MIDPAGARVNTSGKPEIRNPPGGQPQLKCGGSTAVKPRHDGISRFFNAGLCTKTPVSIGASHEGNPNDESNPNDEIRNEDHFVIRISDVIRHL
jgi:hypothetical protein